MKHRRTKNKFKLKKKLKAEEADKLPGKFSNRNLLVSLTCWAEVSAESSHERLTADPQRGVVVGFDGKLVRKMLVQSEKLSK